MLRLVFTHDISCVISLARGSQSSDAAHRKSSRFTPAWGSPLAPIWQHFVSAIYKVWHFSHSRSKRCHRRMRLTLPSGGIPPLDTPPSEVRLRLTSDRGSAPTPTVAVLCIATVGYPMPPSNQMCTSIIIMTPVHEVLTAAFPRASRPWTPLARLRTAHTVLPHWLCSTVRQYRVRQPYRRAPGTPSRLPGP